VEQLTARLASRNEHKLAELRAALPEWELELLDAGPFPPEEAPTYYENARVKALFGRRVAADDVWIFGEDSGIEVDALDGRPGIESARWAGEDHVAKVLAALRGVPAERRRARYVCELVALSPERAELRGTGIVGGRIAEEARGAQGFGFDPVFVPEGESRTVAELGDDWKSRHSHRARAARQLHERVRVAA
jgi:XTP/dITP diphosphohydrolase